MPVEILVIREKDRFSSVLIEKGFAVTNFPTIKAAPLEDLSELDNCLQNVEIFDGIFITSANAAKIVLEKLKDRRKNFQGKIFVLGGKSFEIFKNAGFEIFFSEQAASAEEMLQIIPESEITGKNFLFPRGDRSLRIIPETLKNAATVREVVVYETMNLHADKKQAGKIKEKLKNKEFAAACFFSPSGAESFIEQFDARFLHQTVIAAIGKTTAEFFERRKLRAGFVSSKSNAEVFAVELIEHLQSGKLKTENGN